MAGFPFVLIAFINLYLPGHEDNHTTGLQTDTASINSMNRSLLTDARRNPDRSITLAQTTILQSQKINYLEGMADASLVLGTAWLAKYNEGDSALYYNRKAYDLYSQLDDPLGKARACYGLAYVFSFKGNFPESESYGALSLDYFRQAGDTRGMVNAYNALSYLARQQKDIDKARDLTEKAIETARTAGDTLPLASALNDLGNIYKELALFGRAIDAYFEALELWELKGDTSGIAIAYGSIGLVYFYQKDWDKALEFTREKLTLSMTEGNMWEVSKTYNNIAQIFNATAAYDSALIYFRRSLDVNREMNLLSGIAESYHNIATTYLLTGETDSAGFYINRAMTIAENLDNVAMVNFLVTRGKIQAARKDYVLALKSALPAYNMAKELRLPLVVRESSALLSDIYNQLNRYDLAYSYLREYQQLSDSITNDEFLKRVTRLEIQYEFDKKQKEAEFARMEERIINENRLRQQKIYVNGLLILLVLLVVLSFLYIRHNRLRAQYTRMDLEQKLLRTQMNPHFIFNSLCAVQDFILARKPEKANTFLVKIARLMRNILENSKDEFIPLEKEIETERLYLDLQQLRFENGFDYNILLDESIDPGNISVPPMLAQPCIENSIEHGLLPLEGKGNLEIVYSLNNGLMKLEITDNGVGRIEASKRKENRNKKKSVSINITSERLRNFRRTFRQKNISYEIRDLYINDQAAGTKVIMMLPYQKIYL